ncbi:ATP-binding protein [Paraburkholderia phymatum]|uniref:ATP-binding protein n=1 Tax=Paraburkholderia phymatum TaxID=148447 RepID=UPI003172B748
MIGDRHLAQLLAMGQLSQQLSRGTDEAKLLATFVRGAISVAEAYRVRLVRNEGETFLVECEAQRSQNDEIIVSSRRPLDEPEELFRSAFHTASETGMPVLFGTTAFDPAEVGASYKAYALEHPMLCVPLLNGDRSREILFLDRQRNAPSFEPSLIAYLRILSSQAAVKLEHVRFRARIAIENRTREEVEIALHANEKELVHAQRMSQTGSWRWYAIADIMQASPECFRIYDIPHERRVPSATFANLTHPDDYTSVRIALGKAVTARRVFKLEFRITVGFGEIKYVQIEGHPQTDDIEGLQYVGVVVDVTERRNAENALQAARAELARAHRLSTMGEMAASIVHEVYQPLTGIITNAEVCLRWLSKSPAETARASDSARRVVRDAHRAAEVFRGLRAVASNSGIVKVPVDLDDAIREVAFLLQGELDRANIRLRLQTAAPKPVLGDRTQIQQVLENLMRNAMDALLPVIGTQRSLIVSSMPHDTAFAIVTVQDNGCGFGEHSPEELFDALFTTKPNGMGMGLKVCRSIVEAHGGVLQAERREQHTVFRFTLPYIDDTPDE